MAAETAARETEADDETVSSKDSEDELMERCRILCGDMLMLMERRRKRKRQEKKQRAACKKREEQAKQDKKAKKKEKKAEKDKKVVLRHAPVPQGDPASSSRKM